MLQSVPVHRSGVIGTTTTTTVRLGDVPTVHGQHYNISFPHLSLHSLSVFLLYLSPDDHVGSPLLQRVQLIKYSHCTYFVICLQLKANVLLESLNTINICRYVLCTFLEGSSVTTSGINFLFNASNLFWLCDSNSSLSAEQTLMERDCWLRGS